MISSLGTHNAQATRGVSQLYDTIEDLFSQVMAFLDRLKTHLESPLPLSSKLQGIFIRTLVKLFEVLAIATKHCGETVKKDFSLMQKILHRRGSEPPFPSCCSSISHYIFKEDYIGVLFGKPDLEDALKKLGKLTNEELLMTVASTHLGVQEGESSSFCVCLVIAQSTSQYKKIQNFFATAKV